MKRIEAYIKRHKLDDVSHALRSTAGVGGLSVTEVRGWGRGKVQAEHDRPATQVSDFEPHLKIELHCRTSSATDIVDAIREAAYTGIVGDGIIVVSSIDDVVRIRTGESADDAL